jgi:hypothetical protein
MTTLGGSGTMIDDDHVNTRLLNSLFKGAPKIDAPWPRRGGLRGVPKVDPALVAEVLASPAVLVEVDPTTLNANQSWIVAEHVAYYLTDQWHTTGRTSAQQWEVMNRFPLVLPDYRGRPTIMAAYLGQTAIKTRELCERALGGVLFIDEAYTLTQGHHNDYGEEAIGELLTFMENHRGQFAVIVAGYPGEMHEFLESNPGLRSRFDEMVAFPDYSDGELLDIFQSLVDQHQFTLTPPARVAVGEAIAALPRGRAFANARAVRQLFNNVVARHARGLAQRGARSDVMNVIEPWAVPNVSVERPAPATDHDREHPGYL